ncbi:MAG: DnaT-like ssDNA-binding domain-containing protein [Steroidobacteraceae bacterium]
MNLKLEEPPTPLSEKPEIKNARTRKRKPQTFINPDYKPDFKSIALAAELGIDLEAERRKFINYWLGRGDSKADWDATFRNWIGRSAEYSAERKQRQANGRQGPASVVEAALRVAARYQTNS